MSRDCKYPNSNLWFRRWQHFIGTAVRYGRVPKRSRERSGGGESENRVTQSDADESTRELENKQLAMYDIILTISQAHHAHCAYTEEKTRGIIRKPAIFVS